MKRGICVVLAVIAMASMAVSLPFDRHGRDDDDDDWQVQQHSLRTVEHFGPPKVTVRGILVPEDDLVNPEPQVQTVRRRTVEHFGPPKVTINGVWVPEGRSLNDGLGMDSLSADSVLELIRALGGSMAQGRAVAARTKVKRKDETAKKPKSSNLGLIVVQPDDAQQILFEALGGSMAQGRAVAPKIIRTLPPRRRVTKSSDLGLIVLPPGDAEQLLMEVLGDSMAEGRAAAPKKRIPVILSRPSRWQPA